jgi:uncharacterized cofD-like protein
LREDAGDSRAAQPAAGPGHAAGSALVPGGPRVVAIGGGHGLYRSLGAARRYAGQVTAVVSVADDGGSSGRLREALGIPAPGDVRRCIGALLPGSTPLGDTLEHRFAEGELAGHAFGNLLLAALSAATGDFVSGIEEACRLLGTVGQVLPATDEPVQLRAESASGALVGQVRIMGTSGIMRVSLDPPGVAAPTPVLEAIRDADQLLIGPGSLYTSVLAALAPVGIVQAIAASSAQVVYLCNLREQVPETAGYDVAAHLGALLVHAVLPDVVLADTTELALGEPGQSSRLQLARLAAPGSAEHDEKLLAEALISLLG